MYSWIHPLSLSLFLFISSRNINEKIWARVSTLWSWQESQHHHRFLHPVVLGLWTSASSIFTDIPCSQRILSKMCAGTVQAIFLFLNAVNCFWLIKELSEIIHWEKETRYISPSKNFCVCLCVISYMLLQMCFSMNKNPQCHKTGSISCLCIYGPLDIKWLPC